MQPVAEQRADRRCMPVRRRRSHGTWPRALDPAAFALEGIGGQADTTARLLAVERLPVQGDPGDVELSQARQQHGPIVAVLAQRWQPEAVQLALALPPQPA